MKYVNDTVRRRDRLMDKERARQLLGTAEYGVLSMIDETGRPYGIPVNFVWDGKNAIYIHCAPEGKKLRAIAAHPAVSFCIIGRVNLLPDKFTTEYESVLLTGNARADLTPQERMHALELLVNKLSADFKELGRTYSEKSFHRVQIIRVDFTEYTGKRKYVNIKK